MLAMRVDSGNALSSRKFSGEARAANEVVLAFEVPGKLNKIPVDIGNVVKKGQVLASLDARDFENALVSAQAEKKRAKAQYERIKKAAALNAVSKQELTDAEAAYQAASADVKVKAKAKEDATLRAPYDAVVSEKYVSDFGNVQSKEKAIKLVDPTQIEMVVNIPEDLIQHASYDLDIVAEFDALPGVIRPAKVTEIGAEASSITRTYPVTITIEQVEGNKIKPGMSGRTWAKKPPATVVNDRLLFDVPLTAVGSDSKGQKYIWVIDEETGVVAKREVKTDDVTQAGIQVEGLQSAEIIAVAGVNTLKEGQKVRVIYSSERTND